MKQQEAEIAASKAAAKSAGKGLKDAVLAAKAEATTMESKALAAAKESKADVKAHEVATLKRISLLKQKALASATSAKEQALAAAKAKFDHKQFVDKKQAAEVADTLGAGAVLSRRQRGLSR